MNTSRVTSFDGWVLQANTGELEKDGRKQRLQQLPLLVLEELLAHPGELVTREQLISRLWPKGVVDFDTGLNTAVRKLRVALDDVGEAPRYIETIPRKGYRFIAAIDPPADVRSLAEERLREPAPDPRADLPPPVLPVSPRTELPFPPELQTPPRPPGTFWWGIAAAVILAVAGALSWIGRKPAPPAAQAPVAVSAPSIAVLPFVDMSAAQDQAYFADGLSEEILNLLAQAKDLRVIARTSSFSFKDQRADIHTIAQRLEVTHVLEGSVRKSGDRVRITAQLIDGATSAHVWSDSFDRDVTDIFGVQSEIAAAVADALHVTLKRPAATRAETRSPQAYDHYLQGRLLFSRRAGSDLLQAKSHFEKAVELDPEYGRAWAALAGVYLVARYEGPDLPDATRQWGHAVQRATTLSPDLPEAHYRAAQFYWHQADRKSGDAHIERAIALDPEDPLLLGMSLTQGLSEGRIDDVIATQRKLVAVDPLSAMNRGNLGQFLMLGNQLDEAERELERSLELSPDKADTWARIADVRVLQGRSDEAITAALRIPEGYVRDQHLALAYFARGDVAAGEKLFAHLRALATKPGTRFEVAVAVAEIYAARKDADGAFHWLEIASRRSQDEHGAMSPWLFYDEFLVSAYLMPLHADPRWRALRPAGVYDH